MTLHYYFSRFPQTSLKRYFVFNSSTSVTISISTISMTIPNTIYKAIFISIPSPHRNTSYCNLDQNLHYEHRLQYYHHYQPVFIELHPSSISMTIPNTIYKAIFISTPSPHRNTYCNLNRNRHYEVRLQYHYQPFSIELHLSVFQ